MSIEKTDLFDFCPLHCGATGQQKAVMPLKLKKSVFIIGWGALPPLISLRNVAFELKVRVYYGRA